MDLFVKVAARDSLLSQKQVQEVLSALQKHHPKVRFINCLMKSRGDLDQATSLRSLEKSDFFTKELDEAVLDGSCHIGIHAAKDLPDPLTQGLSLIALTQGIDPSDVLVVRDGETIRQKAKIATSSWRRQKTVESLYPTAICVDIRGTIEQRLLLLDQKDVDAVVMAKAALLRLGLTHRTMIALPGPVAPLQGKLAIVAKVEDVEMQKLFDCLHRPV